MADIEGFIDEVIVVIRSVAGAKMVPDDPTPDVPTWPFVPVYLVEGKSHVGPPGSVTYLDKVTVGFLAPADKLSKANQVLLPKKEVVIEAIYDQLTTAGKGFTNVLGFTDIDYVYGPLEWGGLDMFGFLFTIQEVKIQREY